MRAVLQSSRVGTIASPRAAPMKGASAKTEAVRAAPIFRWASKYKRRLAP